MTLVTIINIVKKFQLKGDIMRNDGLMMMMQLG